MNSHFLTFLIMFGFLHKFPRWLGRQFGKVLDGFARLLYRVTSRGIYFLGLLIVLTLGILLTFLGNLVLLILGVLVSLLYGIGKGFLYVTERLMVGGKWLGGHVQAFQENFFQGVTDVFKKEEEYLSQELTVLVKSAK